MGQTLQIDTPDGTADAYLTGSGPAVLFFIDAIGLRPQIETMADRIAGWGYTVLAPNVFYRSGTAAELAPTTDLRDPENRKAFFSVSMPRVRAYTPDRSTPDTEVWLATLAEVAPGPVGVTGYCMGARLAIRAAAAHPERVVAAGGFHGGGLVTDDADSPHRVIASAQAEFLFGHADHDTSNTPEQIADLDAAMDAAGLTWTGAIYPDAPHGYTMADTSSYQEAGAERMFAELEELFARTLRAS